MNIIDQKERICKNASHGFFLLSELYEILIEKFDFLKYLEKFSFNE